MDATPSQRFCAHLRRIVVLLEGGDRRGAAAEADVMRAVIPELPRDMAVAEAAEARQLVSRYGSLCQELRQGTLAALRRVGAARQAAGYRRRSPGP
ncbi:MAG: hypothetical protein ABSB49_00945 [Polyangia bacterium]